MTPLYEYVCEAGHVTERLAKGRDESLIYCGCGLPSERQTVNRIAFTGFARVPVDQREIRMGAYNEASQEIAYRQDRQTNVDGSPANHPSLWKAAKREAKRLEKLGVKDSADLRS